MEVNGLFVVPAVLASGMNPRYPLEGNLRLLRLVLDTVVKRKLPAPAGNNPCRPVRSQSLY